MVRMDSSSTGFDFIDTVNNGLGYFGFPGIGFDVSSFASSCKKVSFSGGYQLTVDNDSIGNSFPYIGANYTVTNTSGTFTTEGKFDFFHFYSTNIINNICIEACDSVTAIVDPIQVSFNIYPNPVTSILQINTPTDDYETLLIMAMDGRIVKQEKATRNINVADLANGAYKLLLTSNNGVTGSATFIKK